MNYIHHLDNLKAMDQIVLRRGDWAPKIRRPILLGVSLEGRVNHTGAVITTELDAIVHRVTPPLA